MADIVGSVLYNGQAGLIDLDLNQQQKVLSAYAYASAQPDYGTFLMAGSPKAGQSLDEVRDLLLAEAAKIRAGEFDEGLIKASINNYKMQLMNEFDKYDQRAMFYVYSFIYGKEWADDIRQLERMERSPSRMWWTGPTNTSVPKVTPSSTNAKARTPVSRRSQPRKSRPSPPTATRRAYS